MENKIVYVPTKDEQGFLAATFISRQSGGVYAIPLGSQEWQPQYYQKAFDTKQELFDSIKKSLEEEEKELIKRKSWYEKAIKANFDIK